MCTYLPYFASLQVGSCAPPHVTRIHGAIFANFLSNKDSSVVRVSESPGVVDPDILKVKITLVADEYKLLPLPEDFTLYTAPGLYYSSIATDTEFLGSILSIVETYIPVAVSVRPSTDSFLVYFFSSSLDIPIDEPALVSMFSGDF